MFSPGLSLTTFLELSNMEANLPKVEHRISLLINHTSITHICPLPQLFFLVYEALVCMVHSVLCTVYSVMYVQFLVCLFYKHDWQSLNKA